MQLGQLDLSIPHRFSDVAWRLTRRTSLRFNFFFQIRTTLIPLHPFFIPFCYFSSFSWYFLPWLTLYAVFLYGRSLVVLDFLQAIVVNLLVLLFGKTVKFQIILLLLISEYTNPNYKNFTLLIPATAWNYALGFIPVRRTKV